ncbi:MAG: DNA-binding protein [Alphaproteobacteria bacterium]|nr:DNA-binding protein [Alphaproteobacteria bacterium]
MDTTKTDTEHEENPYVLSVPKAGRKYFDLGRGASYEAAKRGDIPTIRIGRKLLVPVQAVERKLSEAE